MGVINSGQVGVPDFHAFMEMCVKPYVAIALPDRRHGIQDTPSG